MSYFPTQQTLTVGGRVFTDLDNLKVLYGNVGQTSGAATLREPNSSSGYVVPALKTFKILAIEVIYGANVSGVLVAYGDTDVGMASTSYPTNVVYTGGDQVNFSVIGSAANTMAQASVSFNVPAGKYPCSGTIGAAGSAIASIKVYGYEV